MLLNADGVSTNAIMRMAGVAKTAVWRRQKRLMTAGVEGLLRDKTRLARIAPLGAEAIGRPILTKSSPP